MRIILRQAIEDRWIEEGSMLCLLREHFILGGTSAIDAKMITVSPES
jgi:hypothetical protein